MNEVQAAQAIKAISDNLKKPAFIELINLAAQEKFAKYQAFMRAGFGAKQALELVIREGEK